MPLKLILFILILSPMTALAQANAQVKPFEFALAAGPLLPSKVPYVREILLGFDVKATLPTSKGLFEIDGYFANGDGTSYKSVSLDYRADLGADIFPAFFLIGFHGDFYTPSGKDDRIAGGWHFGGGLFQPLFSGVSLREDFRYRFGPGQELLVTVGLSYQFGN